MWGLAWGERRRCGARERNGPNSICTCEKMNKKNFIEYILQKKKRTLEVNQRLIIK
jgi:hypothetical protein